MKINKIFIGILILCISIFVAACTPSNSTDDNANDVSKQLEKELEEKNKKIKELELEIEELSSQGEHLITRAIHVLESLEEKDMKSLKEYIHPQKGLRFTPYPYVDLNEDIVLEKDEIEELYNSSQTYNWGSYDGKGTPIELTFAEYYEEFIYDEDFLNPQIIGNNKIVSGGNTIDNVEEAYPDGEFTELYFEGFEEQYSGMDWKSLKLVFEQEENDWYLVGIIHGQWTI